MITVAEISRRLNDRVESICQMLLPGGRVVKNEYCCGNISGGPGDSLKVHLSGNYIGHWTDWATDHKGDLIDLWRIAHDLSTGDSVKKAKEYLGIHDELSPAKSTVYRKAPEKALPEPRTDGTAWKWLRDERKLTSATLDAFKLKTQKAYETPKGKKPNALVFESYNQKGEIVNRSYRSIPGDPAEKKQVWQDFECAPCLYGWHALPKQAFTDKTVLICEGQIDAMTWHQWGIPALSVSNGSGMTWLDYEWENLEYFQNIYLNFDADGTGDDILRKTIARLGPERCFIVSLPHNHKDANDCLKAGCTAEDAKEWIAKAKAPSVQGLISARDLTDRLLDDMKVKTTPFTLRFMDLDWRNEKGLYFRDGEVTLWTGTSHAGKSTFLNYLNNMYLPHGNATQGVFVGSFEVKPERTLKRMATAFAKNIGWNYLCRTSCEQFLEIAGDRLFFADVVGFIEEKTLLDMMRFAFKRFGVTWFVIDSLMKIKGLDDDYPRQNDFVNRLQEFAKSTGSHVHLVAHPRKGQPGSKPGLMDVKGSSTLSNSVDNVVVVCRNHDKAEAIKDGEDPDEFKDEYDTEIRVEKQKESGWMGAFFLSFDPKTYTYKPCEKPKSKPPQKQGGKEKGAWQSRYQ